MTPSEKSESSGAQSGQQDPTPVSTQTVGNVENAESASATVETPSASAADGSGAEEGDSTAPASAEAAPGHGEATEPPEVPPPWQRAAVATGSTGTAGAQFDQHSSPADTADTQRIPKPNQDQDTVRTGMPNIASAEGQGTAAGAAAAAGSAGAATGATAGPGSAGNAGAEGARTSTSFTGGGSRSGTASGSSTSNRRPSRGPRRASLQVKRVDPWSVLKLALVLNIALFFVWMIAVAVLYGVLDGMGTWDMLNGTFTEMVQQENAASEPLISAGRVFGWAAIIGGINIVLITALATVGAFIYNVAADFAGGLELTLSERE